MTQPTYDLLTEPWIPVLRADGTADDLGLRDVLQQAHKLRSLTGETPLVTASLYRLLLAVLYRALGAPTLDSWESLWERGHFPQQALEAYWQRWHARFDLFHPERPFLQWPNERGTPKPIIALVPHMASGNNPTLFDHHHEGQDVALSPAEAARALLVALTFGLAGGMGMAPKDSSNAPWARGIVFLAEGDSLFETLMLNYLPIHLFGFDPEDTAKDRPFWEAEHPNKPRRDVPLGVTDYLTWPNRLLHLLPYRHASGWRVKQVRMVSGLSLNRQVLDPYKHYFANTKAKTTSAWQPLKFEEAKALWRDSASLLQLRSTDRHAPQPLHWMARLAEEEILLHRRAHHLMALGWATGRTDAEPQASSAKVHFCREEHFSIPHEYLLNPELVQQLTEALALAEAAEQALKESLSRLAVLILFPSIGVMDNNTKLDRRRREAINNLTSHWAGCRFYWGDLEMPFQRMLLALPQEGEHALDVWRKTVHRTALDAFRRVAESLGKTPRVLKAVARAERQLLGALFCVFHPQDKKCRTKNKRKSKRR